MHEMAHEILGIAGRKFSANGTAREGATVISSANIAYS